ncbi:MAG: 50S ribosomal protein L20 [bacterium]
MTRVKRGTTALKSRKNILRMVKGYRMDRGSKERSAQTAIAHAGAHAFVDRRDKKGEYRRLFNVRINAGVRPFGLSYSKFINILKKKNIALDRKVLSEMADKNPETFARLMKQIA